MKKISRKLLFIPFFIITLMFGSTSCSDDTDCKIEIVAKLFGDTTIVVPYANVWIHQKETNVYGITDATGKYEHTFALEAIFNVTITDSILIDTTTNPDTYLHRIGEGTIRLKPGETVRKSIIIK